MSTLTTRSFASRWRARQLTSLAVASALTAAGALTMPLATSSAGAAKASGTVDVLYCGSFLDLMTQYIGPAFHRATGYTVSGFSNGSTALATEIKGKVEVGDVFISASPTADTSLEGSGQRQLGVVLQGVRVLAARARATTRRRSSPATSKTKPWYNVVDLPHFLLGPNRSRDRPQGRARRGRLDARRRRPTTCAALNAIAKSSSNVYEETALVGDLQSGQLDAGFFYAVEAAAAHIKTVPLDGTNLAGEYTVTILNRAPHEAAAKAFVNFLLSAAGQRILRANGVTPIVPAKVFTAP